MKLANGTYPLKTKEDVIRYMDALLEMYGEDEHAYAILMTCILDLKQDSFEVLS